MADINLEKGFSFKTALDFYSKNQTKEWGGHNRLDTVGASEVGQCMRKIAFNKLEKKIDPLYEESRGAMDRGNVMEMSWWEPAVAAYCEKLGLEFLFSGDDQSTLVDGYLSATPDGLIVGAPKDCLKHLGIDDIESESFVAECKSIDPRASLHEPKHEHVFQVQIQMGLIHAATNYRPRYAVITYIDASFWDDIREFVIEYDPTVYEIGKKRALKIMSSGDPLDLNAEGAGTSNECNYCEYKSQCKEGSAARVPTWKNPITSRKNMLELMKNAQAKEDLDRTIKQFERELNEVKENIKRILEDEDTSHVDQEGVVISYSKVKGRRAIDWDSLGPALEAADICLEDYKLLQTSHTRLTTKLNILTGAKDD